MVQQAIVDPIDTFERLVSQGGDRFQRCLAGPPAAIPSYWRGMKGHILFEKIAGQVDVEKTIALALHGDGAPTTRVEGLFTVSWGSMHAMTSGTIEESRHIFAIVRKSDLGDGALDLAFKRLAWSMNALLQGRMPACDWLGRKHTDAGRELAHGYTAACMHLKGDWELFLLLPGPEVPCPYQRAQHVLVVFGISQSAGVDLHEWKSRCWLAARLA